MRRILTLTCLALLCSLQPAPAQTGQAVPEPTASGQPLSRDAVLQHITRSPEGGGGKELDLRQPLGQAGETRLSDREMKAVSSYSKDQPREGDLSFRGKNYRYVPRDPRVSEAKGGVRSVLYFKNKPQYR